MIVDDVRDDNVSLVKNKKGKNIENNEKMCPHGTYTCWGPQGPINICVALVCLNMASNHELFIYMHVYAFVRHLKGVC